MGDLAFLTDEDAAEQGLVDPPSENCWGGAVGGLDVLDEIESGVEVGHQFCVLVIESSEACLYVAQALLDPLLLAPQQVKRDGIRQMSLQ